MSSLSADILVGPADLFSQTSNVSTTVPYNTGQPQLGIRGVTGDGREFRFCQAGGSNLVVGNLLQAPAQIANHRRRTPTAASAGATSVTLTLGATAVTANQYNQGWLVVEDDSGGTGGFQYQIKNTPAALSGASITVTLADPLVVALTASAHVSLVLNPYSGVIQMPSTATSAPVGVALGVTQPASQSAGLTASYYGWIQERGVATVLSEGGSTVGAAVAASDTTAGAVETCDGNAEFVVGCAYQTLTDTDLGTVLLTIG